MAGWLADPFVRMVWCGLKYVCMEKCVHIQDDSDGWMEHVEGRGPFTFLSPHSVAFHHGPLHKQAYIAVWLYS